MNEVGVKVAIQTTKYTDKYDTQLREVRKIDSTLDSTT